MSSYQLPEEHDYIEVYHPYDSQDEWDDASYLSSTPRQSKQSPLSTHSGKSRSSKRKGSKTTTAQSGSDTEKELAKMPSSRSSRHSSSASKKDKSSSSKSKKTDDWTDVTEPDERRRIQNRIAQRKFREKAREQKDRAARDAQNQQYAGAAYHVPDPDDFTLDDGGDLSGLPWGGLNMRHVVARGHASASVGSHHTHSHHSGHTGSTSTTTSGIIHTPGPAPVDQVLYQMDPYGYAAYPTTGGGGGGGSVCDGMDAAGDVYGFVGSPYGGGYHYDPAGGDPGAHGM